MRMFSVLLLLPIWVTLAAEALGIQDLDTVFELDFPQVECDQEVPGIPFAVVEEVPVFPGCEEANSNQERKECFSENINNFVTANFDLGVPQSLGLSGLNRIYAQFKIDAAGKIKVLGTRSPHPAISEELERVLNLLPKMTPGKQRGQQVGVLYSLPFSFRT